MFDIEYINTLETEDDIEKLTANYVEIKALLLNEPRELWTYEMKLAYARAICFIHNFEECHDPFGEIHELLLSIKGERKDDKDWYYGMANVCYNMQLYRDAVKHIKSLLEKKPDDEAAQEMLELYDQ